MRKIAYSLILIALAACTADDQREQQVQLGRSVSFSVTEGSQWQTRGAVVADSHSQELMAEGMEQPLYLTTTVVDGMQPRTAPKTTPTAWPLTRGTVISSAEQKTSIGVSAFRKKGDASLGTPDYFYDLPATKNEVSGQYSVSQNFFWPAADETLHFYAYYPYNDPNVVLSPEATVGPQKLTFTVDPTVANQVDLMTAVAVDATSMSQVSQPTVTLPFRHELCAVSFKIDDLFPTTGGIVSVGLKNVYGSGTMTINQGADGTWTFRDADDELLTKTSFTATINKENTQNLTGEGENGKLIADNLTFLMIPQELSDDAVIEMVYQDSRQNYTLTASLKDALKITDEEDPNVGRAFFEAGKTITFALSSTTLSTLKIGTITWPNAYEASASLPKSAYAEGDQAGLYVVAANNTDITYRNIPVTFDGEGWVIDHETDQGVVYYDADCHYYLYYPYTPTPNQDYPLQGQGAGQSTVDVDFFSSLITGWGRTVNAPLAGDTDRREQSQEAGFTLADLQIAELTTAGGNGYVSTLGATLKHAMGLAVFNLQTDDNVPTVTKYALSTDNSVVWTKTTGSTSLTASGDFSDKTFIPYKLNNTTYIYWVKPGQTTSVSSSGTDTWAESVNIALNESTAYDEAPRSQVVTNGVLTVNDIPSQVTSNNNAALTPSVVATITVAGETSSLTYGTDFTVANSTGSAITAAGSYTINITPAGEYSGNATTRPFTVEAPQYNYVDLGLPSGLLWCDRNVGATSATDNGWYFNWASTTPHTGRDGFVFSWQNTPYYTGDGSTHSWSKYSSSSQNRLDLADDAARVNMGGLWRMPTLSEFQELLDNTNRSFETIDGVEGWKFANKSDASKYIFLPNAGHLVNTISWFSQLGYYRSSSLVGNSVQNAYLLWLNGSSSIMTSGTTGRYEGESVRAVQGSTTTSTPVALSASSIGQVVTTDAQCYASQWEVPEGKTIAGVVVYKSGSNGIVSSLSDYRAPYKWSDFVNSSENPKSLSHTPEVAGYSWICGTYSQYSNIWGGVTGGCSDYTDYCNKLTNAGGYMPSSSDGRWVWTSTELAGNTNNAWFFDGRTGGFSYYNKNSYYYCRPIFAF